MKYDIMTDLISCIKKVDKAVANYINFCIKNDLTQETELQELVKHLNSITIIMRSINYED